MEKQERIKTIAGISLLYLMITSIFSLIGKLCSYLLSQNDPGTKARLFWQGNLLWIAVVAVIIIALILSLKKLNQGSHFNLLDNSLIRITAGTLAALDGIISLASAVPTYVTSIQSALQLSQIQQNVQRRLVNEVITLDVVFVLIDICQIAAAVWLVRFHKAKAA